MNRRMLVLCLLSALLVSPAATGQTSAVPAVDGKAAFERLKGLAGVWSGPIGAANGNGRDQPRSVRITSGLLSASSGLPW